ncbi:MAG: SOS response-associated peptidase [Deltaproteobacteria bacterium]|nr:SOS response-associated peptidase [Deltaproteobacteria bacterium]
MCGRYSVTVPAATIQEIFAVDVLPDTLPRYNVAPTQAVSAVVEEDGIRRMQKFRWGLVPSWSKDGKVNASMINARSETVVEKPAFRAAFKRRRCLVPSDGFYEWKTIGKAKIPHRIGMADGSPFAIAGIWEVWRDKAQPDADPLLTMALLTTGPNGLMEKIHDRMPVILAKEDWSTWLSPDTEPAALLELLRPFPAEHMAARPVSRAVSNARNEGEQCLADASPEDQALLAEAG